MLQGDSRCVVCGALSKYYSATLYKCTECGHMTDIVMPNVSYMTSEKYMNLYRAFPPSEQVKMQKRWETVQMYTKGCKTLLDFGCGQNLFIKSAPERHGFEVMNAFDANWRSGYADERVLDLEYDVMTAFHIFEHALNPWAFLNRVKHKYLFIMIPWIEYVPEDKYPSWPHFSSGQHMQFFTRKSLMILLKGYEILEENYVDGELSNPKHPEWIVGMMCRKKS